MDAYSIQQKLQNVNLSKEEALIYISLLKLGETSVANLAKIAGFKRSTTYVYLKSLEAKSLIQWTLSRRGKMVSAVDPIELSRQIQTIKDNLVQAEISYRQLLPQLNLIKKQKNYNTEVKYYQGVTDLKQILEHSLEANKNTYGYSSFGRNEVIGVDYMTDFRQKCIDRKLFDHVITNNSEYQKNYPKKVGIVEYLKHQEVRFLSKDKFYISSDILIYNDVYAVISLDKKNPIGVEIINEEIVKTQMSIFNYMWQLAKPVRWKI